MNFVFFDHKFFEAGDLNLTGFVLDGSFCITQKIWFRNNELPLFSENLSLMREKAGIFRLGWNGLVEDPQELLRLTKRLLNKNRLYKTGLAVLKAFWQNGEVHILIQAIPSTLKDFHLAEKGILMNFSDVARFSGNPYASFDHFNLAEWGVAFSEIKDTMNNNSIILNQSGAVCEAIGGNIFFIRGRSLITPSPDTGCYLDPVRKKIIDAAVACQFQVMESSAITKDLVYDMDEIFIASEAAGMQWVIGIDTKRFIHYRSDELNIKLNELLGTLIQ